MYIKKYIYSSNEELMKDNDYSKIQLTKNINASRIKLTLNFKNLTSSDRFGTLMVNCLVPIEGDAKEYIIKRYIGTTVKTVKEITPTLDDNGEIKSQLLELDLSYVDFTSSGKLIVEIYSSIDFTDQEQQWFNENNLVQIYGEVANYQGIGASSKVDPYEIENAKVLVNRADGALMYNINLLQTLHKKVPITLSLLGGKDILTTESPTFTNNIMFDFQNKITKITNEENVKTIEVTNAFNSKSLYIHIEDIETEKYKYYISHGVVEGSEVYFNGMDGSYICNYKDSNNNEMFKLISKNGNSRLYENSNNKTKLINQLNTRNQGTTYTWYQNKLDQIVNSKGEIVTFEYNENNCVSTIIYNGGTVEFEYGDTTVKISYYNPTGTLINYLLLSYDGTKLIDIEESRTKNLLKVSYLNEKVSKVQLVHRVSTLTPVNPLTNLSNETLENNAITTYEDVQLYYYNYLYGDCYTKLTSYNNESMHTYFDSFGRIKLEMDDYGNVKGYEYVGDTEQLSCSSTSVCSKRMLINNNGFEEDEDLLRHWTISPATTKWNLVNEGVFGKCLKIYKQTNATVKTAQTLKNIEMPLNKITFYAKKLGSGTVTLKCQLRKSTANSDPFNLEKEQEYTLTTSWKKYILELSGVTSETGTAVLRDLIFEISGESENEVYLDDVNINDEDRITRTNLLINGDMDGLDGWTFNLQNSQSNPSIVTIQPGVHAKILGNNVCYISDLEGLNVIKQTIIKTGSVGDTYLLSAFVLPEFLSINGNTNNNVYIKFTNGTEVDKHATSFTLNINNWQAVTKVITSKIKYSSIEVGIEFDGEGSLYIDNVQLLKQFYAQYYQYDAKGNISEVLDTNGDKLFLTYDNKNKISYVASKDNQGINYFYDLEGKLIKVRNSRGVTLTLEYDDEENIINKVFTLGNKTMTIHSSYDANANETLNAINNSDVIRREFNTLGDLAKITTANNVATNYGYNIYREVNSIFSSVNGTGYANSLTYNNYGEVKTITSQDGKVYAFTYDDLGQLKSVAIDGVTISSFTYGDVVNGVNTGLVTQKTYDSSNIYSFEYDELKRITNIKYNSYIIVKYEYDENGNISKVADMINDITNYYTYDYEGKLVKLLSSYNEYNYEYDNQNKIQSVNYNILNNFRHVEYEYNYERDKLSFLHYIDRQYNKYKMETITADSEGYGFNGLSHFVNTATTTNENGVNVFYFTKFNHRIGYNINKETDEEAVVAQSITREVNQLYSIKTTTGTSIFSTSSGSALMLWIKPKLNQDGISEGLIGDTNILYTEDNVGTTKLAMDTSGYLHLTKINTSITENYISTVALDFDKWNHIVIVGANIYLNGNQVFNQSFSFNSLKKMYLGKQDVINEERMPCSFKVAIVAFGKYENKIDVMIDYVEGLKALNHNTSTIIDKTTYLESAFNNKYEVYSLNGSIMSNRNDKLEINNNDNHLLFEYDDELMQYVYSSYYYKNSKLYTKLKAKDKGFVSVKFKIDSLNNYESLLINNENYPFNTLDKFILTLGSLMIWTQNNNLKVMSSTTYEIMECGTLENDKWYTLTIFNGDEIGNASQVYLDNNLLVTYNSLQYGFGSNIYIGSSDLGSAQLDGWFSSLVIKDGVVSTSARSSVLNELMSQHKIEYIQNSDALGQVTSKGIKVNDNVLMTTNYTYSGVKLAQENLSIYNEKRVYTYDNMNNVVRIVKTSSLENRTYAYNYDGFGRLVNVNDGNNNIVMTYDDHGNILKRQQAQISAQGMTQNESFSYDAKDRLRILTISSSNGQEEYELQYNSNKYSPNKIIKRLNGGEIESKDITYEGKRVKSIGKVVFFYNEEGIRIRKVKYLDDELTIPEEEHNYILEGDRILTEYIITSTKQHRLDYNYDINGELVSVEYGGNVYYYVRDALGNINHIIDSNRNIVVSYEYNEWGKVSKTIRVASCLIGELNPFMYKGYYYDVETQLYWVSSRYYSPELCRWISPDSIEYLDPESINGLNLYAYCGNDPVM